MAADRLSGASTSPSARSTANPRSESVGRPGRTRPRVPRPRRARARTIAEPTRPAAPVTTARPASATERLRLRQRPGPHVGEARLVDPAHGPGVAPRHEPRHKPERAFPRLGLLDP